MSKPESFPENEMYKILWDFEIQADDLIIARRQEREIIKKQKRPCHLVDFAVPADHRAEIKVSEKINKYSDLA